MVLGLTKFRGKEAIRVSGKEAIRGITATTGTKYSRFVGSVSTVCRWVKVYFDKNNNT